MTRQDVVAERLAENLGKIEESNRVMSQVLVNMEQNLKILNDQNILHATKNEEQHKTMTEKLQDLTARYWWLIVGLIITLLLVLGYKEATGGLIPGA